MIRYRAVLRIPLGFAVLIGLGACGVTDTTRYYTLGVAAPRSAPVAASASATSDVAPSDAVRIGVGPVIVPAYLERQQIVNRTATSQVELSMFHRWAEPLPDGIARVLAEEISARVPAERVVTFPWRGVVARSIQYQVVVVVLRLDGHAGGDVTLDTRWRILGRDDRELAFRRSTMTEPAGGAGHEAMVATMTRAVVALGQEIAIEIRALPR